MISLAHIINPVNAPHFSDLSAAQPVTFTAMTQARSAASEPGKIQLYSAQFQDDRSMIPAGFIPTPNLTRSVLDVASFRKKRRLPLIGDILDRLYAHSHADYLIYSNVDIAPMPYFYSAVRHLIKQGYDAFAVNRRTISASYSSPSELPLMYAQAGKKHKGWDCFIFRRSLYHEFNLGHACIGAGWIGRILIMNLACLAEKFHIFTDFHLTFHLGNQKLWRSPAFKQYTDFNRREGKKILDHFDRSYGPLDRQSIPGSFYRTWENQELETERP